VGQDGARHLRSLCAVAVVHTLVAWAYWPLVALPCVCVCVCVCVRVMCACMRARAADQRLYAQAYWRRQRAGSDTPRGTRGVGRRKSTTSRTTTAMTKRGAWAADGRGGAGGEGRGGTYDGWESAPGHAQSIASATGARACGVGRRAGPVRPRRWQAGRPEGPASAQGRPPVHVHGVRECIDYVTE